MPPWKGQKRLINIQGKLHPSVWVMDNPLILSTLYTGLVGFIPGAMGASISPLDKEASESSTQTCTHLCSCTAELARGWDILPKHLCPTTEALLLMSKRLRIPEPQPRTLVQALNYRCAWNRGAEKC